MLTGRPPFQGTNALDTLLQVRLSEPMPPRVLQPRVPRDLETIALKCLQKEPRFRYASARELAEDLRRFQDDKPIGARPASLTERAWKAARRRPAAATVSLAAMMAAGILFAIVACGWQAAETSRAAAANALVVADDRLAAADADLYANRIAWAHERVRAGKFAAAAELLALCEPPAGQPDHRSWEWYYLKQFSTTGRDPVSVTKDGPDRIVTAGFRGVSAQAVSPDGRRSAKATLDGKVVISDLADQRHLLTLRLPASAGENVRTQLTFSPDGRLLVATWGGGTAWWGADARQSN